jgi:hypothetical protein
MLSIEKNWRQKSDFLNFICRESKKIALGKEIFGESFFCAESFLFGSRQRSLCAECFWREFFLCRELFVWLSAKKPLCRVFFLCREFFISLSAKPFLPRVFYLALRTETNSGQNLGFR